jgi:hypothetical protein
MSEGAKRRLVDRVIDPSYLEGVNDLSMEDVRARREEAHEAEKELSFERRLCQARIDILTAELDQRSGKAQGDLIDRLPAILAAEGSSSSEPGLPSRAPDFSIPRNADVPRRRVEEVEGEQALARLSALSDDEIRSRVDSLKEHERTVSDKRLKVQAVVDMFQAEIVRRYAEGEADPAASVPE